MPLLKKKALEKTPLPEDLRDDEEVFHCKMTNEIFREYEEFAERTILCNSMVWTCSLTGKSNLTYVEALQSEENARRSLKDFPVHLRIPVLYLANKTRRSSFTEMAEDVFCYVKDRYFVGENIEACFSGNKWRDYCVLQVIGPGEGNAKKAAATVTTNGTTERQFSPHPSLYKYDLEQLETEDDDVIEKMMVDYTQIRRRKGTYTREKNKLFLRQYVEQTEEGRYKIKESALKSFGVNQVKFEEIFDGNLPDFTTSKRVQNNMVNGKRTRQETLAKYLTKSNGVDSESSGKLSLIEEIKKKEQEYQREKEKKQKKEELKQKKKQELNKITQLYNKWCKPKDDLELEDQKKLPILHPVKTKVPDEYVGEMLMVLEFVNSFSNILRKKDFFPGGFTLDILERALTENEVSGPLIDLIQMLLNSLFALQEEESTQTKIKYLRVKVPAKQPQKPSLSDCALNATAAIRCPRRHHGLPLEKLPMYSLTISEILRLHLLSSGARIQEGGAKWRYQHRGGYTNEDDPGLLMCWQQPQLIQALSIRSVAQFSIGDKLKLISCLIDQLLTYADVRDVIEDRLEASRQHRVDLKSAQFAERKRCTEFISARNKFKSEHNSAELERLKKENEQQLCDYMKKISKLSTVCSEHQILLGFDRAFRRYLKLESVPGLFVDSSDTNAGSCLNKMVHQNPQLVDAEKKVLMNYIKNTQDEMNTSDKENDPNKLPKLNGTSNCLDEEIKNCEEYLMCSADPKTCPVHSDRRPSSGRIEFFSKKEQLDELINSLNKRGVREGELQQTLKNLSESLAKVVSSTPNVELNPAIAEDVELRVTRKARSKYEDTNLGYPTTTDISHILHTTFTENILEMEEKIFVGYLGIIKVKDRSKWRKCLLNGAYASFDRTITRSVENKNAVEEVSEGSRESTPDNGRGPDPVGALTTDTPNAEAENTNPALSEEQKVAVECLAIALAQIAYAVNSKYLQKPLGHAGMKEEEIRNPAIPHDVLKNWESSVLSSTSYSQLFLHYDTLDSCIMWSRSALLARCRICRRQADSENMLLCDNCNCGQHLYCHRPILESIPQGKWFCLKCSRDKEIETRQLNPEPEKKKRRRIFRDEDIDEDEEEADTVDKEPEIINRGGSDEEVEMEESDEDEMEEPKPEKCSMCGSDGDLLACEKCSKHYHVECLQPPLRRKPRGQWFCNDCKTRKNVDKAHLKVQRTGVLLNQRRCATRARHKIHGFIKSLRGTSFSKDAYTSAFSSRRVGRREADDLPLHNAALHDLLNDVMKNVDAWPFIRPVQKNEVPDYYEVITKPMDFGTIKYKLNMGKYTCDEEFMADAVLIFENCNTYNDTDAEVYKCGVRLLRLFEKISKKLGLKLPEEMQDDNSIESNWQPKNKKRRGK